MPTQQEVMDQLSQAGASANDLLQYFQRARDSIDTTLEQKKTEFDNYLLNQTPTFQTVYAKKRVAGLVTGASVQLAAGETIVLMTNHSSYIAAQGILTLHIQHSSNGAHARFLSFSGYGLDESNIGGATDASVSISIRTSEDVGGEHLGYGQCELLVTAIAIDVGLNVNFVNLSPVSTSIKSAYLS